MGAWGTGLFANDIACDVRDTYMQFLQEQLSDEDAYQKTVEEYHELSGTAEEPFFWYALADTQWKLGRLMPVVKDRALEYIQNRDGLFLFEEDRNAGMGWLKTLQKLQAKLESEMPLRKKIRRPTAFKRNPWNIGDIYAYQFHTPYAEEQGLLGKYILFQKVGNYEFYKDEIFSVIQVFDYVYDEIPTLGDIKNIRILPLAYPPGVEGAPESLEDYIPSFETYMRTTMIYEKKKDYPEKYFTFVGNRTVPKVSFDWRSITDFYWESNGMEKWLCDYYLQWQGVEYT